MYFLVILSIVTQCGSLLRAQVAFLGLSLNAFVGALIYTGYCCCCCCISFILYLWKSFLFH